MNGVLLDTHALIWYLANPERLSVLASEEIDNTVKTGGSLFVSVISIVEIIYLVEKGKIPEEGLKELMENIKKPDAELKILPVDLYVADELQNISREQVTDMPDRIIAATSRYCNMSLITKDNRIIHSDIKTIW